MDDEPALRDIFARWLSRVGGGRVLTAADGKAALAVLEVEPVDLLITDVRMPVMDGVTLVRSLAKLAIRIPSIVFVSGFGEVDRKEMYGLGVEAFIPKPFDRKELLQVIEQALAQRSTLWLEPMAIAPRQSLAIEAREPGQGAERESIRFGRGGFSAHSTGPLSLSKVSFRCSFPAQDLEMTGQGYVRWTSREAETVGIEFAFLDQPCRPWLLDKIELSAPRSFIPDI